MDYKGATLLTLSIVVCVCRQVLQEPQAQPPLINPHTSIPTDRVKTLLFESSTESSVKTRKDISTDSHRNVLTELDIGTSMNNVILPVPRNNTKSFLDNSTTPSGNNRTSPTANSFIDSSANSFIDTSANSFIETSANSHTAQSTNSTKTESTNLHVKPQQTASSSDSYTHPGYESDTEPSTVTTKITTFSPNRDDDAKLESLTPSYESVSQEQLFTQNSKGSPIMCNTTWTNGNIFNLEDNKFLLNIRSNGIVITIINGFTHNNISLNEAKENVQSISDELDSCEQVMSGSRVDMVDHCPADNIDRTILEKCESRSIYLPPVSVAFPDGDVTFRNIYCAQCHNVKDINMTAWSTQFTCNDDLIQHIQTLTQSDVSALISSGRCQRSYISPGVRCHPRECDQNSSRYEDFKPMLNNNAVKALCNKTDTPLCQTYFYPNQHCNDTLCLKCLDSQSRKEIEMITDQTGDIDFLKLAIHKLVQTISEGIMIIIDIKGTYSEVGPRSETFYGCQSLEVFDSLSRTCKTLICPPWSRSYKGRCIDTSDEHFVQGSSQLFPTGWSRVFLTIVTDFASLRSCEVSITLSNRTSVSDKDVQNVTATNKDELNEISYSWSRECHHFFSRRGKEFENQVNQLLVRTLKSRIFSYVTSALVEFGNEMAAFNWGNEPYRIYFTNKRNVTFPWHRCPDNDFPLLLATSTSVTNITDYVINTSKKGYYPLKNIGFEIKLSYYPDEAYKLHVHQTLAICGINWLSFRANCSVVRYWLNETVDMGSMLFVLPLQRFFDLGDFQVRGDMVFVCSDFKYRTTTGRNKMGLPYIIVSWIFTLLSTICLLLMLVLYWLLPELRTLPGKMTANLAATMMLTFLSSSVSMHDLYHEYVCPVVAALSHVVTLAHFGWMSAISVNMALTFGPLAKTFARSQKDNRIFRRYCLVVWGMSLVLVMTSVVLDLTHTDPPANSDNTTTPVLSGKFPRYGYPFCTWFSGPLWTRLAFIIIPYIITFVISLLGFILTLIGMQQARKSSEKLNKNTSQRARSLIYIKLSSAMGFSWIISVAVSINHEAEALKYIYVCLVLVQGVLLFLSFMVNQRVYSLLQKRLNNSSEMPLRAAQRR